MGALAGTAIELRVEQRGGRPAVNPVMRGLLDAMSARGAQVDVRVAEREAALPGTPGRRADLVLLKTTTPLALGRAMAAERAGQRHANRAAATARAADKAAVLAALAAHGVAVPETYLVTAGGPPPEPAGAPAPRGARGVQPGLRLPRGGGGGPPTPPGAP